MKRVNIVNKRFFAFGCSYTEYSWPTWADLLSFNFDQYYNFGRAGCSNSFIKDKFIEADAKYRFNSETDYVVVMFTGFGRYSYFKNSWRCTGDLHSYLHQLKINNKTDTPIELYFDFLWSGEQSVYKSWIAIKLIKTILTEKNIKHKLLLAIDNSDWINVPDKYELSISSVGLINNFYELLDTPISVDEWLKINKYENNEFYKRDYGRDGHPTTKMWFDYIKEYFYEFVTLDIEKYAQEEHHLNKIEINETNFMRRFLKKHGGYYQYDKNKITFFI